MRAGLVWIVAIVAGIALVIGVTAAIGTGDDSGETVTAGEWAQTSCGAVGVWRGEMEDIVEELRTPSEFPASGAEEPQSETPQGRTGFVRIGLERAVQATDTMIEGIDNAGTPDTPQGQRRRSSSPTGPTPLSTSSRRRRTRSTRRRTVSRTRSNS